MTEDEYTCRERENICEFDGGTTRERAREIAAEQLSDKQSKLWPSDEEARGSDAK